TKGMDEDAERSRPVAGAGDPLGEHAGQGGRGDLGHDSEERLLPTPDTRPSLSSAVRHAEDEDPFGREEALQADRQGQGPRPSRLLEPHPQEEVAQAQAGLPPAARDLAARRPARQEDAGGGQVTRVKRSVNARKKRRATLERAKG